MRDAEPITFNRKVVLRHVSNLQKRVRSITVTWTLLGVVIIGPALTWLAGLLQMAAGGGGGEPSPVILLGWVVGVVVGVQIGLSRAFNLRVMAGVISAVVHTADRVDAIATTLEPTPSH